MSAQFQFHARQMKDGAEKLTLTFSAFVGRELGKNASPTKASPLKESVLCYIQTCHLWDTGVEMSPRGAIRLTPAFLKSLLSPPLLIFQNLGIGGNPSLQYLFRSHSSVTLIRNQLTFSCCFSKWLCNPTPQEINYRCSTWIMCSEG